MDKLIYNKVIELNNTQFKCYKISSEDSVDYFKIIIVFIYLLNIITVSNGLQNNFNIDYIKSYDFFKKELIKQL
jgi:hypothetical protein